MGRRLDARPAAELAPLPARPAPLRSRQLIPYNPTLAVIRHFRPDERPGLRATPFRATPDPALPAGLMPPLEVLAPSFRVVLKVPSQLWIVWDRLES
jgi:hypothetical protein